MLWLAIQALASMHDKQQVEMAGKAAVPLHVFIYTGDLDATSEDILKRAEVEGVHCVFLYVCLSQPIRI